MKTPILVLFAALLPLPLGAGVGVWTTNGPASPTIAALAGDPLHPGTLYAGGRADASGDGVFLSTDDGASWTGLPLNRSIIGLAVESAGPNRSIRASDGSFIYSSASGGALWLTSRPGGTSFTYVATTPSTVLAGVSPYHYCPFHRCYDGFDIVDARGNAYLAPRHDLTALAFDPSSPGVLYAAATAAFFSTRTYGSAWSQGAAPAGLSEVSVLAVNPADTGSLLAGTAGAGAFRTTDGGSSWAAVNDGLPEAATVRAIAFSPNAPGKIFLGTDAGVFQTSDSGDHWSAMNDGLTNLDVTSLAIDSTGQFLRAGTNGGGVFDIELMSPACADPSTLCLQNGRFQVSVQWTDFNGNSGLGTVVPGATSSNSGVMWFFSPDNWELLIKVLDGCAVNGHYWVFGAAATNVTYTIQVTDTQTGEVKTYTNPLGMVSPAITDTTAFGSCP